MSKGIAAIRRFGRVEIGIIEDEIVLEYVSLRPDKAVMIATDILVKARQEEDDDHY